MARKAISESQRRHIHDALAILFGMAVKERVRFDPKIWPVLSAAWESVRLENEPPLAAPESAHKQASNIVLPAGVQALVQ